MTTTVNETTPGPWHWSIEDYSMACLEGPGGEVNSVMVVTPCKSCQARVATKEDAQWEWGRCWTPSEADAHLIAAAPTMYAALRKIDEFWTTDFPEGPVKESRAAKGSLTELLTGSLSDDTIEVWRLIRAALAAADGRDPEAKP